MRSICLAYLLWLVAVRVRCAGLFHRFETVDTGDYSGYVYNTLWYCTRCYIYERDDEVATANPFERLVWGVGGWRLLAAWHNATWRFER